MAEGSIRPEELIQCLCKAAESLEYNYDILNNLNVFPVPDGDTGTNMLSSFEAGVRVLKSRHTSGDSIRNIADRMNAELMKNSRGNSGFILARFFHGFFEAADGLTALEAEHLAAGFSSGLYHVQISLFTPVEGTMITIIRAMAEVLKDELAERGNGSDLPLLLGRAVEAGRTALRETPRLLPILAKAGVVDSGALGFIFLMDGFRRGLTGEPVIRDREEKYRFVPDPEAAEAKTEADTRFYSYCTELIVHGVRSNSRDRIARFLERQGNSIALVCEEGFLKLHIHTDSPEEIITYMKSIGTVEHIKIDNLTEQVSRYSSVEDPDAHCAVLAFIPGEGFRDIYSSLGVEHCILYTSHLPTAGEIHEYIQRMPEKNIIILPNNGNILPAVISAANETLKHVSVIHTATIVQGLTTAYGYSGNDPLAENVSNMKDCADMATGIFLYRSTMESGFGGHLIHPGEYFALCGEKLAASGKSLSEVAMESIRTNGGDEAANITIFYQSPEVMKVLEKFERQVAEQYSSAEIEYLPGGQFRETLIISLE